eukprot:TRINITY_DN8686_c0_g1_i1.p1 TRINITY_DN8686_c0_g1~~TRINITY_DN8686_c0_g1_i1.p1  ORF type:complete len:190 (+),score=18.60 TRINITY_DN8686_c0_g1_i1:91-660(+)
MLRMQNRQVLLRRTSEERMDHTQTRLQEESSIETESTMFSEEQQLIDQPRGHLVLDGPKKCGLCGSEGKLTKTPCCNNWVCDDASDYVMFSYSRSHCSRSHDRYTLCGQPTEWKEDWRFAENRKSKEFDPIDYWYGLNAYNFYPMLEVPYTPMTMECSRCHVRINPGYDDGWGGSKEGNQCWECINRRD